MIRTHTQKSTCASICAAPAGATGEVVLRPGQRVRVHGLQSAAGSQLNGALGALMRYDAVRAAGASAGSTAAT